MSERTCLNCRAPTSRTYDLLVRGNRHQATPLCDQCYEALEQELTTWD